VIHERDGQRDRQTLHDSKDRAYASHCAVKIVIFDQYIVISTTEKQKIGTDLQWRQTENSIQIFHRYQF